MSTLLDEQFETLTNRETCANCLKSCDPGVTYLICSACRSAAYCSKGCQRSHWKNHKPRCKARQEAKKVVREQGNKRGLRLLESWKASAKNGILEYVCLSLFGFDTLNALCSQQQAAFVNLNVEFNYNKRTFVPTEKPDLVPIDVVEEVNKDLAVMIRKTYKDVQDEKKATVDMVTVVLLLTTKDPTQIATSIMPLGIETPANPMEYQQPRNSAAKWDQLLTVMSEIRLKSRIFDSWASNDNMKQQMEVVRRHPKFQPLLVNALRIETAKDSLHKTHILTIFIEMGNGLGQVRALQRYEVTPVSKVKSMYEKCLGDLLADDQQRQLMKQQLEYTNAYIFDLEGSPSLLQSRMSRPNNALLPVLFIAEGGEAHFAMPNFSEIYPDRNRYAPSNCDKKARKAFQQLSSQVKFPSVVSPDLQ